MLNFSVCVETLTTSASVSLLGGLSLYNNCLLECRHGHTGLKEGTFFVCSLYHTRELQGAVSKFTDW
jgi:hypothetical protein